MMLWLKIFYEIRWTVMFRSDQLILSFPHLLLKKGIIGCIMAHLAT